MLAVLSVLKKIWPYLLIAILGLAIYFGFVHFSNQIEELTRQNTILEERNAEKRDTGENISLIHNS